MSSEYKPLLIPLFVAASLAGVYFIRVHMVLNNGGDPLNALCLAPPAPRLPIYTSLLSLTDKLPFALPFSLPFSLPALPNGILGFWCILSEFFLSALIHSTPAWRTALECLGSLTVPVAVGWLESYRTGRSLWVAFPAIWALAYQLLGGGIIIPLQMLAILLTADHPTKIRTNLIPRADAEGVLVGLLLGYVFPSLELALNPHAAISALWQPFPLYVSLFALLYSRARRLLFPASGKLSGYWATQLTYALAGLLALAAHGRVVYSIISSPNFINELKNLFIPSVFNLPPHSSTNAAAWHMLKWDNALMFGSTLVAGLWMSYELGKGFEGPTAIAILQGVPAFGPGAVAAVVWIWREKGLRELRGELDKLELEEREKERVKMVEEKVGKSTALDSGAESGTGSGADTPLRRSKRQKSRRVD